VALRAAVSKNRRIPLRISGGLPYSPYTVTPLVGDLEFERAESELRFARESAAPPSARLNLARVYLARAWPGDSEKALRLLDGIQSSGARPAEILNETGIANFMLGQYAEAISTFTHALGAEPKMAEALFNKAYTEERVDRQAARQDWENFIAWTSDPDWTSEARERLAVFD
jgi:tetratricopeptide (TPR) repeat protein